VNRTSVVALLAAFVMLAVMGCSSSLFASRSAPHLAGEAASLAQPDQPPGTILGADALAGVDMSVRSAAGWSQRITYISKSGVDDHPTRVTGSVFVPKGSPPPGGWPVVGLAPAINGRSPDCAASLSPTLLNASATVQALVDAGYVVSVPDYQGLGSPGAQGSYYPYLDSTTAGNNLIDAVRAARRLVPDTSERWVAFGASQGGQAAWAADELADSYGSDLKLLGAVSLSPISDIDGLADAAAQGGLSRQQKLLLLAYLGALKDENGADFDIDDYRRGFLTDQHTWDMLSACGGSAEERARIADEITTGNLRPDSAAATATLRGYLQKTSLPQGPAAAPMLVIYGDHDPLMPRAWTDRALDRACTMGDVISIRPAPGLGPDQIDSSAAFAWLGQRFSGQSPPNDCPLVTATDESPSHPSVPDP
jgi:alpha-beta hydrolase superfamily lysophospholipase